MALKKVVIIGLGLIGGSIGLALKRNASVSEIVAIDKCEATLKKASELGAADTFYTEITEESLSDAELIIFAVPFDSVEKTMEKAAPFIPKDCIVTDVTSIKSQVLNLRERILPKDICFIGGHPMAGSESSGIEAADPFLFENAIYILTPRDTAEEKLKKLQKFVKTLGAKPLFLDPERHDFLVAMISHLPHLVAASLNLTVSKLDSTGEAFTLAAGGFKDTTRIASSKPEMWSSICRGNKEHLINVVEAFQDVLNNFKEFLKKDEEEPLKNYFEEAKNIRDSIPSKKGLLPRIYELLVTVPDKPGEIGKIGTLLGKNKINISELEILRIREGDGGTMRLSFQNETALNNALEILQKEGYKVRKKV